MMKRIVLYLVVLTFVLSGCNKDDARYSRVVSTNKIWSAKNYSAFTDLVYYKDRWYCIFREAASHVGTVGQLRIMESVDAQKWNESHLLSISGKDLRDPKFLIQPNGQLVIHAASANGPERKMTNLYWEFSGTGWSEPKSFGDDQHWLWRVKSNNGRLVSIGYNVYNSMRGFGGLSIFSFKDLKQHDLPDRFVKNELDLGGCPTEAGFVFLKDKRLVVITRRDCSDGNSFLGISEPPYTQFAWHDLHLKIQSPNLLLDNDIIYVGGRVYTPGDKTSIYLLDLEEKKLNHYTDLKSDLDTGYPGMVVRDKHLYVSYYSSDGFDYRAIFLAKVELYNPTPKGATRK